MSINDFFRGNLLGKKIEGFPYPEKYCAYCRNKLSLIDAVHILSEPQSFKALFLCANPSCDAYDEPGRKAYAKIYYSSEHSYRVLEGHRISYDRESLE